MYSEPRMIELALIPLNATPLEDAEVPVIIFETLRTYIDAERTYRGNGCGFCVLI